MENERPYHRIGIIGSGRVAQALALALHDRSAAPVLLWSRDAARRLEAASRIDHAEPAARYETILEDCDLIAIAIADDAIAPFVAEAARVDVAMPTPFIFHLSGRTGAAVLDPLQAKGALTAAIHPVMTFAGDAQTEVRRMAGARFAITAPSSDAVAQAKAVVGLMAGVAVEIPEALRPLYHAGLCHAANHLVTLMTGSCRALVAAGVGDPAALLAPLVRAALENSLADGFAALSGPLLRGDRETIDRHLVALADHCPEILPAYRAMATATLDELERDGTRPLDAALRESLR